MPVSKPQCNKVPYATKQEAAADIKHIHSQGIRFSKRRKSGKTGKKMRPYICPKCCEWHITTVKQY